MKRCEAIKREGGRCERIVSGSQDYCYAHDPAHQEERKRNAARGGRAKAAGEIGTIKRRLQKLADGTLSGEVDRSKAAVVTQIWNTYISAIRTEMKERELTEMETRLAELEQLALQSRQPTRGGRLKP
jgi:hypothetical protein